MKSPTNVIIEALTDKIQKLQHENSFLLNDLGVYTRETERLDKENKELKEKYEDAVLTWKDSAHVKYDELKHEYEVLKSAYGLLALKNEELKDKLQIPSPPLDLDTPEGYYANLIKLPFKHGKDNFYVYYDESYKRYDFHSDTSDNLVLSGLSYISKADAEEFCKKFNK